MSAATVVSRNLGSSWTTTIRAGIEFPLYARSAPSKPLFSFELLPWLSFERMATEYEHEAALAQATRRTFVPYLKVGIERLCLKIRIFTGFADSDERLYGRPGGCMFRFQCPVCGFGDHEVGHLAAEDDVHCIVCLEEQAPDTC
jgi:hypothetical protein